MTVSGSVRLRYPIIVNYVASMYRMASAVAFLILIIRKLSVYEFGLWGVAFSLSSVFAVPAALWLGWARRFTARGVKGSIATSLLLTVAYAALVAPLYLVVAWLVSLSIGGLVYLALYGYLLLAFSLLMDYARSLSDVLAPEITGYAIGLINTLKLLLAATFVLALGMKLQGAFLAIILARAISAAYIAIALHRRSLLRWDGFSARLAKSWMVRSYVTVMGVITSQLRALDKTLAAIITGSAVPSAYLGAAYTARTPIGEAGRSANLVLSARLLRRASANDVTESLRLCLLFSGFMLATAVALGRPILSLLNPSYVSVYPAFVLAGVAAVINNIGGTYAVASTATETADVDLDASLLGSRLVRTPLVVLCCNAVALLVATAAAWVLRKDFLAVATVFPSAWLCEAVVSCIVVRRHALEAVKVEFPWRDAASVAVASLLAALSYVVLGAHNIVVRSFWRQAAALAGVLLLGFAVYIVVLYVLSKWFRSLVSLAVKEALSALSRRTA